LKQSHFWRTSPLNEAGFRNAASDSGRQGKMSSSFLRSFFRTGAVAVIAVVLLSSQALSSRAFAQSDDEDPSVRIDRLENQLRQLTGQNEELQYRNRQLEDRLRQLQAGQPAAPGGQPAQPNVAVAPPVQLNPQGAQPGYAQPQQPQYAQPQGGAPAPIVQDQPAVAGGRRRGDAFDPNQNPAAPGVPLALGGGQLPMSGSGRPPQSEPGAGSRYPQGGPPGGGAIDTAPPTQTPRDEYDLGIGYMQRKDYALADQTMRNFAQKYPNEPLVGDAQYWLGESLYQRQQYREAAEIFLAVTTKYDKSAKAPDAMLRLGQSLAALKEKEAACSALGAVPGKYPRASAGVKATADREFKRVKC
jgi:tol-pal system protein YbgF